MKLFKLLAIISVFLASSAMADTTDYSTFVKHKLTAKEVTAMKKAIGKKMKDADSVRLTEDVIHGIYGNTSEDGMLVMGCAEFNAKNSYGGYGDPAIAIFYMRKNAVGHVSIVLTDHEFAGLIGTCAAQRNAWSN